MAKKTERIVYLILLFACATIIFYLYQKNREIKNKLSEITLQEEVDELLSHKLTIEIIDLYHEDKLTENEVFDLLSNYYIIAEGCNLVKNKKSVYILTKTREITKERLIYTLSFLSKDYNSFVQNIGSLSFLDKIEEINQNAFSKETCTVDSLILPDFNESFSQKRNNKNIY